MTEQQPPLWEKIRAVQSVPGWLARRECAAILRVITNEVVPEEQRQLDDYSPEWHQWAQRLRLRQRLLAEADRAEAGQ